HRERRMGPAGLVEEDVLLDRRAALPPVLLRPSDPQPAVAAELPDDLAEPGALVFADVRAELLAELGRQQLPEVRAHLVAKRLLFRCVGDAHRADPTTGAAGDPCSRPTPSLPRPRRTRHPCSTSSRPRRGTRRPAPRLP